MIEWTRRDSNPWPSFCGPKASPFETTATFGHLSQYPKNIMIGWTWRDSNPWPALLQTGGFAPRPPTLPPVAKTFYNTKNIIDGLDGLRTRGLHVANVTIYP